MVNHPPWSPMYHCSRGTSLLHFAQILLVRKRNLLLVLHTRYMSQDHLNLAFDAVLGVRVIKCTSLLTVIEE